MGKKKQNTYNKRFEIIDHPVAVIAVAVISLLISVFFFFQPYYNKPIKRQDAKFYSGKFSSFESGKYTTIYLDGSDYCYYIDPSTENNGLEKELNSLKKGTMLYIAVNPKTDNVIELKTDERELLNFDKSQAKIYSSSRDNIIIGALLCFLAVFLIAYVIGTKKSKQQDSERIAEKKATIDGNSQILRSASSAEKFRVLAETEVDGYNICYRRVKYVNELVVNGWVYDEKKGVIEFQHKLCADIDGHSIEAGFDGDVSYISFDGDIVEVKRRFI